MNFFCWKMLKYGSFFFVMIFVLVFVVKNEGMCIMMKYKDFLEGDKSCVNCVQFVVFNGCKLFLGDMEVFLKGYCVVWVKKV